MSSSRCRCCGRVRLSPPFICCCALIILLPGAQTAGQLSVRDRGRAPRPPPVVARVAARVSESRGGPLPPPSARCSSVLTLIRPAGAPPATPRVRGAGDRRRGGAPPPRCVPTAASVRRSCVAHPGELPRARGPRPFRHRCPQTPGPKRPDHVHLELSCQPPLEEARTLSPRPVRVWGKCWGPSFPTTLRGDHFPAQTCHSGKRQGLWTGRERGRAAAIHGYVVRCRYMGHGPPLGTAAYNRPPVQTFLPRLWVDQEEREARTARANRPLREREKIQTWRGTKRKRRKKKARDGRVSGVARSSAALFFLQVGGRFYGGAEHPTIWGPGVVEGRGSQRRASRDELR